jgi:putative membrane protein
VNRAAGESPRPSQNQDFIRIQASACFRFLFGRIYSGKLNRKKHMKIKVTIVSQFCVLLLSVAALSVAGVATAQDTPASKTSSVSAKDKTFMKKAARGGMMEVAMGNLAQQNAQSEDVKSFGKRMVTDHSKANDELKSIAERKDVTLPKKEPKVKWTSDKAYMDAMVKDHEKDLAEFQKAADTASDPDVKKFAEDTAKMIQEHLNLAKETQGKLQ